VLAAGGELGRLEIALTEDGKPIDAPAGARGALLAPSGAEALTLASAEAAPTVAGFVPPGKYGGLYRSGGGRAGAGGRPTVDGGAGRTVRATIPVTKSGKLALTCTGEARTPSPCKVTIDGVPPTRSPDFGPGHAAGPAKNQITSHDGVVEVPIAVGKYAVTVS